MIEAALGRFFCYISESVFAFTQIFPTLPFSGMTVLIPGLPVVIRHAADYV